MANLGLSDGVEGSGASAIYTLSKGVDVFLVGS